MASKLLTFLGLLSLSSSSFAGITTYAYNPFIRTYAVAPTAYVRSAPLVAATPIVNTYSAAAAPLVQPASPVVHAASVIKTEEIDPHPQYEFSYDVHDSVTGDIKNQVESRDGGNVAGAYSVIDADGYKRTVTYTADDINGFNAVVQRDPIVAASPVVAKSVAAPVLNAYVASPLVQATPVVEANVAAPVVRATAPIVQAAYAATPAVHANYATAPFVKTYSAAPYYLSPTPAQQQVSFLSSPALAVNQQNSPALEQHGDTAVQAQEENQQFAAPQQTADEPTPVEYHQQEQQATEHDQKQEQPEQNEQQQFIKEQQQIFAEQQQQFAAQQQQVILQQQQLVEQQQKYFQQQQQQFANSHQFPAHSQYQVPQYHLIQPQQNGNTDSEVIEARAAVPEKQQEAFASEHQQKIAAPGSVNEQTKYSANKSA